MLVLGLPFLDLVAEKLMESLRRLLKKPFLFIRFEEAFYLNRRLAFMAPSEGFLVKPR